MPSRKGKPNKRSHSVAPMRVMEAMTMKDLRELYDRIGKVIARRHGEHTNVNDFPTYDTFEQVFNDLVGLFESKTLYYSVGQYPYGTILTAQILQNLSFRELMTTTVPGVPLQDIVQILKPLLKGDGSLPDYKCWAELKAYRDDKSKHNPYKKKD